ncbi:MAG: Transcriptional regulator protein [uncultured bacterium]|nr:MAG: Transcriptional regulator protein [uncultured bacterium]
MLPKKRPSIPGEFIKEDILKEFSLTQDELAHRLGVSRRTVNELVNGKRGLTADIAVRLAKLTNTSSEMWMNLQTSLELWEAARDKNNIKILHRIRPCCA